MLHTCISTVCYTRFKYLVGIDDAHEIQLTENGHGGRTARRILRVPPFFDCRCPRLKLSSQETNTFGVPCRRREALTGGADGNGEGFDLGFAFG